ncbi:hypothetical protein KAU33_09365 [Candidatus Dependentiae bacterium]|nr:hypothetical protein [Candidatus Dependentiae bacterium]
MPSNMISINGSDELTWIVVDSEMEELINHLDKIGEKYKFGVKDKAQKT